MTTDRVILQTATGDKITAPWAGLWPPPERLYLVRSGESFALVDPDAQSDHTLSILVLDHDAMLFTRDTFSKIEHPSEPHESWFRGAVYRPWKHRDAKPERDR